MNQLNGNWCRGVGAWVIASIVAACAVYPVLTKVLAVHATASAVARAGAAAGAGQRNGAREAELSLRVQRLDGLLASWETIGGCGAGTSTSGGGGLKWIGHSVTGGLFNLQTQAGYTHQEDGYILTVSTQITTGVGERWVVGVSAPFLYKYYRDYKDLPVDISNAGIGDASALITYKFGEIKATALTLTVAYPSGTYDAAYKMDYLSQEKQLGIGKVTGGLTLDHTMDEQWGVIVLGGSVGYRGGENELGNYRAPVANAYGYVGYFTGPFVPSLGLTLQRYFFGPDRDRGLDQQMQIMSVTGAAAVEWSNDSVAILAGVSLPFGWEAGAKPVGGGVPDAQEPGLQPWTVGLGLTLSPF